jgi:hypothetical protein
MARGVQVYYTYDQHWTWLGHAAAAEKIRRYLADSAGPSEGSADSNRQRNRNAPAVRTDNSAAGLQAAAYRTE